MTIELRPLGVKCNLSCSYCYQNPQREAGNILKSYDMKKMKESIEKEGGPVSLFGGEALLIPLPDLEEILSWCYTKWGRNSIQTNGTLITDQHISLFLKYNVHVGISIDGPAELNNLRIIGDVNNTLNATFKTEQAIKKLSKIGIPPSLIITLHRINATSDKLPRMHEWILNLEKLGVSSVRLHVLESENEEIRSKYALTVEENVNALLSFAKLEKKLKTLKFDLFADMRKMLMGDDERTTCIWKGCDPYTTAAVRGVEGNGQRSNCGRVNKEGIDYVKSNFEGFERYLALYLTPQQYGGCKDCKFFLMCKGNCPGTSLGGDWRNRSEYCEVWKKIFYYLEKELSDEGSIPISLNGPQRKLLEGSFLSYWKRGKNITMTKLLKNKKNLENLQGNKF